MTMQAIQTKYIGPTNTRGARVKAFSEAFPRGVTVPFEHGKELDDAHDAAARAFIVKHEWFGTWVRGGSVDGRGNVYVCLKREHETRGLVTPHPQSCDFLNLLIVRKEGGES